MRSFVALLFAPKRLISDFCQMASLSSLAIAVVYTVLDGLVASGLMEKKFETTVKSERGVDASRGGSARARVRDDDGARDADVDAHGARGITESGIRGPRGVV